MLKARKANDNNTLQIKLSNSGYYLAQTADQILSNVVDMSCEILDFVVSHNLKRYSIIAND
jgi:hypothetical protein